MSGLTKAFTKGRTAESSLPVHGAQRGGDGNGEEEFCPAPVQASCTFSRALPNHSAQTFQAEGVSSNLDITFVITYCAQIQVK
jgi:hypothetical protein